MPRIDVDLSCPLHDSFRVRQIAGMFDLPIEPSLNEGFAVEVPCVCEPWQIGAIVGPSASGKTAVARQAYRDCLHEQTQWLSREALIDCLGDLPIQRITAALGAVGFNSPRSWLKPYSVLSNGERFRCELARALLKGSDGDLVVFDEFTSVVDRTVARIGSAAVSRAIRSGRINRRLVAVTCHQDVVPWLQPDWVLDMAGRRLTWGRLRRPRIRLRISRASSAAWNTFRSHHYLSGGLHRSAQCFIGHVQSRPAAFAAVLPFPHPRRPGWREHRIVCLADFQGVGIGNAMSAFVAGLYAATGRPYFSTTSHPGMIRHRARSALWHMHRRPGMVGRIGASGAGKTGMGAALSLGRLTAGFEYVGPARPAAARELGVLASAA